MHALSVFSLFRKFPDFFPDFVIEKIFPDHHGFFSGFFRIISGLFPDCSGFPFFIRKSVLLIGRAKVLHALWVVSRRNSPSLRGRAKVLHALWVFSMENFPKWKIRKIREKTGKKPENFIVRISHSNNTFTAWGVGPDNVLHAPRAG